MASIVELTDLGQSIWYDYMERRILENGQLARLIDQGEIRGLTSNPSIFDKAIAKTKDYDSALVPMSWAGYSDKKLLEQMMVEDIQRVAELLHPLFEKTNGGDGFVSLEVRPDLAYETEKTIQEAQRLWDIVKRPNLMVKIPATVPGLTAIRKSIAAGININITLIFSIERYKEVMEAYLSGLEDRIKEGKPIDQINSVASFFVSRIDTKVDKYLEPIIGTSGKQSTIARTLLGKIATANSRLAYQEFRKVIESERFHHLQDNGANIQRLLWASTSTKNPDYPDTMYVDELIGEHTVNTVPPQTLQAFKDHGTVQVTIEKDLNRAKQEFADLESLGISMQKVTQELEEEGVAAFSDSYDALIASVKMRRESAKEELGALEKAVSDRIANFETDHYLQRFYAMDESLWTVDPKEKEEVRNRMGWLNLPDSSKALIPGLMKFAEEVQQAGYTQALLLGMGGSSLAAEVMSLMFKTEAKGFSLSILDSTDPAQILQAAQANPVTKTLFIVSSKSGSTAEVIALFNFFWQHAQNAVGDKAGEHFIAITDPGTSLEKLAFDRKFRKIFLAVSSVGGRYSALTVFGLVPAALLGVDLAQLLESASWMVSESNLNQPVGRNPGIMLGTVIGEAALNGKDKLTILADPEVMPFGEWLEQLIAESSGKQGKGILPVAGEQIVAPEFYGSDRLFVYIRRSGKLDQNVEQLRKAGQLVLTQDFTENYALGAEFFKWEIAIATACSIIGVNAFNQPDVQDSKTRTVQKIDYYQQHKSFIENRPIAEENGISVLGDIKHDGSGVGELVDEFLTMGKKGDYIAINAYLDRNAKNLVELQELRSRAMAKSKLATMLGFGPRFQHSTGQLHKGGPNTGLFLVITSDPKKDIDIPGEGLSFGVLEHGQALGDVEALEAKGRRVLRIHLSSPDQLKQVIESITLK